MIDFNASHETIAWEVHKACRETGFFYISNHGVPRGLIEAQFQVASRFFALPLNENWSYTPPAEPVHAWPSPQAGYNELPKGEKVRLYFKHTGGGLMIKPGDEKLTGFVIAGTDKNFVFADAVIEGDTIVVSSPEVPLPKYVRYGWAWNPNVNLFNKAGLPAITFRTDE